MICVTQVVGAMKELQKTGGGVADCETVTENNCRVNGGGMCQGHHGRFRV